MSFSDVQKVMERYRDDKEFRQALYQSPSETVQREGSAMGVRLDEDEWAALLAIDWSVSDEQLEEQASRTMRAVWPDTPPDKIASTEEAVEASSLPTAWNQVVMARAEAFALEHAHSPRQRRLLQIALQGLKAQTLHWEVAPFVSLPLLVYGSLSGDQETALSLAVATSMIYLGADIIDDLADGDLPPFWEGYPPSEISLTGINLLCALPQLALAELDASPACRVTMLHTLAQGGMRMSAGQQQDVILAGGSSADAEEVEASVSAKSGEELALFAALPAQLAESPVEVVDACAMLGRALGTAGQLHSDYHDLFITEYGRDLASGTRTLPIALHLERLEGAERAEFVSLLERAREDRAVHKHVRERLVASGALRIFLFRIEVHYKRALRAVERADLRGPGADILRTEVEYLSLLSDPERYATS